MEAGLQSQVSLSRTDTGLEFKTPVFKDIEAMLEFYTFLLAKYDKNVGASQLTDISQHLSEPPTVYMLCYYVTNFVCFLSYWHDFTKDNL